MSMTVQLEVSKSEIISRLATYLLPLAREASAAGILIQDFERGLLEGLLAVGAKVMDEFLESQGTGDQGTNIVHEGQALHRSDESLCRPLRTIFGEHAFRTYVYRASGARA